MKKTLLLASLLAIALSACGKKEEAAPAPAESTPPAVCLSGQPGDHVARGCRVQSFRGFVQQAQGMPPHAPAMGGPEDPMVQELRQMFGHILTRFADFERSVDQRLSAMEARIDRFVPAMPGARPQAEDAVRHSPPPRIRRKDVATGDRSPASGMRPSAPPPLPPRPDGSSQTQAADPREQRAEWDRRSMDTSVSEHDTDDGRFSDEGPSFSRRRRPPPPPPRQAFPQAAGNTPGLAAGTSDHVRNQYAADFSGELRANVQAETQTKDDGRRHALRLTH
ncbi:hypothetical protein E2I20_25270 [Alcaligenaceae bacterium SAGV3]|nr:hypothetical protein [Alcaligenaceae bacterium SAGV3]